MNENSPAIFPLNLRQRVKNLVCSIAGECVSCLYLIAVKKFKNLTLIMVNRIYELRVYNNIQLLLFNFVAVTNRWGNYSQ